MTVSDRQPSMRLELFYWRLSLMACVNRYVKTDQPPTVSVCLFDGMKVTVMNIFIYNGEDIYRHNGRLV